jgi:LacI family transcriptional regulator, gluconate utilization system Gnt-I transcriptional repressor
MERKRTKIGEARLTDVAKRAGVSPITASRFFKNPLALSVSKRERVATAARELDYVPNLAARALASQRTEVIGVLIPSLTNSVFADVLRGMYDASEGSRYSLQLVNTRYSILQEEKLLRLFQAQKPAGLIVTGIDQTPESRSVMESMDCPIAQIMDIGPSPVDMMVGISQYDAGLAAVSHLINQGFRRIGFLGAQMEPRVRRRFGAYRDAMKAVSLFDPRLIVTTSAPCSVTMGGKLLADHLAKTPDSEAVFCANDDIALGVLFECLRRHMSVPDQMAIVGFNDLDFMASAVPSLSSVRTNRYEMGRRAVTMVTAAIDGKGPTEMIVNLGFELMVRQSSSRRLG